MPKVYEQLLGIRQKLETHYKEMQDIEFTVQDGTLYMLQTRTGKRTGTAAVRIAVEMVKEGLIDEKTALKRVSPDSLDHLLLPQLDPKAKKASRWPGGSRPARRRPAARSSSRPRRPSSTPTSTRTTRSCWSARRPAPRTSPACTWPRASSRRPAARRATRRSSRGAGASPASSAATPIQIDEKAGQITINGQTVKVGDFLTINGTTGDVMIGQVPTVDPEIRGDFATLMEWADKVRTLKVRTNADTPKDAAKAREFGAEGIGLCRTEHMFFGDQRIVAMRKMILADDEAGRKAALAELEPFQREDFIGIFEAMAGLPVTIRLLDPPLHEFLPHDETGQAEVAQQLGVTGREGPAPGRAAPRVQPDARLPRLPPADRLPRDRRHAGPRHHRRGHRGQEEGQESPARDHDPAGRHRRGAALLKKRADRRRRGAA